MANPGKETRTNLLHATFAKNRDRIESLVKKRYGSGNPAAFISYVAERASVASYLYYLEKLDAGEKSDFDTAKTEEDALNLLSMTARSRAMDLIRKRARSSIVHGVLDGPQKNDESSGNISDWFEARNAGHGDDPVLEDLKIREVSERLSELSEDDWAFVEKLIGTQLDSDYARPPYKAVARELGEAPHKTEYRWKKLKARIMLLTRDSLDYGPAKAPEE